MDFTLHVQGRIDGGVAITVCGDLDFNTAERFLSCVEQTLRPPLATLCIDLHLTTFVDASGLGAVVRARKRAERVGVMPSATARRVSSTSPAGSASVSSCCRSARNGPCWKFEIGQVNRGVPSSQARLPPRSPPPTRSHRSARPWSCSVWPRSGNGRPLMVLDEATAATDEQLTMTIAQARLCQYFAAAFGVADDAAFTAGLLSGVAELLHQSPAAVTTQLPLAADLTAALTDWAGPLGRLLQVVHAYQRGEHTDHDRPVTDPVRAYLDALQWSTNMLQTTRG